MESNVIEVSRKEQFIKVLSDIAFAQVPDYYGEMVRDLKLDLLLPLNPEKKLPLIIWVIGGGWAAVNKSKFDVELAPYAKAGFAVASVEYRVSGEAVFPAQIIDVKSAIRYLRANADRFGLDPERFYMMGESSGGHLAALAAVTGDRDIWNEGFYREVSTEVRGCVDLYGICDFENQPLYPAPDMFHDFMAEDLLIGGTVTDHADTAKEMNPLSYANENTPPFLIFHGLKDQIVPYRQSQILYEGLIRKNVNAKLYLVKDAQHADEKFYQESIRNIILDFLRKIDAEVNDGS